MGISKRKSDFHGDIGYNGTSMGILAILKFHMGTLEIIPKKKNLNPSTNKKELPAGLQN